MFSSNENLKNTICNKLNKESITNKEATDYLRDFCSYQIEQLDKHNENDDYLFDKTIDEIFEDK